MICGGIAACKAHYKHFKTGNKYALFCNPTHLFVTFSWARAFARGKFFAKQKRTGKNFGFLPCSLSPYGVLFVPFDPIGLPVNGNGGASTPPSTVGTPLNPAPSLYFYHSMKRNKKQRECIRSIKWNGGADTPPLTLGSCNKPLLHIDYSMVFYKNQWYNISAVKRPAERGDALGGRNKPFACARSECSCRDSRALHNQVAGEQVARPQHSTRLGNPTIHGQEGTASAVPFRFFRAEKYVRRPSFSVQERFWQRRLIMLLCFLFLMEAPDSPQDARPLFAAAVWSSICSLWPGCASCKASGSFSRLSCRPCSMR